MGSVSTEPSGTAQGSLGLAGFSRERWLVCPEAGTGLGTLSVQNLVVDLSLCNALSPLAPSRPSACQWLLSAQPSRGWEGMSLTGPQTSHQAQSRMGWGEGQALSHWPPHTQLWWAGEISQQVWHLPGMWSSQARSPVSCMVLQDPPGAIPEHRARSIPSAPPGVAPDQNPGREIMSGARDVYSSVAEHRLCVQEAPAWMVPKHQQATQSTEQGAAENQGCGPQSKIRKSEVCLAVSLGHFHWTFQG